MVISNRHYDGGAISCLQVINCFPHDTKSRVGKKMRDCNQFSNSRETEIRVSYLILSTLEFGCSWKDIHNSVKQVLQSFRRECNIFFRIRLYILTRQLVTFMIKNNRYVVCDFKLFREYDF